MSANRSQPKATTEAGESGIDFEIRVVSSEGARASALASALEEALGAFITLRVEASPSGSTFPPAEGGRAVFIDAAGNDLEVALSALDPQRDVAYLILPEGAAVPPALVEGRVEDILVHPFRPLEVLSKLRGFERVREWREASLLNASYVQAVDRLQEDLGLAQKLQKSKLPTRFPDVRGFNVTSRYLAGLRSGGNYVDLAESRDGQTVAMVLTDASSYRLSSDLLEALPLVMSGLSLDEARSSITTSRRIRDGVLARMGDQDRISLFYGALSRKDYRLKFVNLGCARAFYSAPGKPFAELASHGEPIVRAQSVRAEKEGEVTLEAGGRLVLVSEGFIESTGGVKEVIRLIDQLRSVEAKDCVNELVFRAKAPLQGPDDLPPQDCTVVVFDVDAKILRLA